MSEPRHWLIVDEQYDPRDPLACMEVEHDPSCAREIAAVAGPNGIIGGWTIYECLVGRILDDFGLDAWFRHRDHRPLPGDPPTRRLEAGRYEIRAWEQVDHDTRRYDFGIELVERPRLWRAS